MNEKVRHYAVKGWEAASEANKYGRHLYIGIVATSADRALRQACEMYPKARMDAVNDCGIIHYVMDVPDEPR